MESNCGDSGQTYRALVGYGMYSDFIVTKTLGAFHQWLSGGKKKNPPAMQLPKRCRFNPWVRKIPWRKKMTTHSSILAWKIPWTEQPGGQSMELERVGHN